MAKRMLIDATHPEETRVVVLSGNRLEQFDYESSTKRQLKGNIYLAKVTRVEPSLQAAFVDYGGNRHGFLAFNEIHPDYYQIPIADREALARQDAAHEATEDGEPGDDADDDGEVEELGGDAVDDVARRRTQPVRRYKIQEVVRRRQILLVQVVKEERGTKGAALTTYLSLAGRYCVLMPNAARGGGISRKIVNPEDRKRLKAIANDLDVPDGMGVILRTAGMERSKAEIKRDFNYLLKLWDQIRTRTLESIAPALIHEEANLINRSLRDLYTKDIEEILVEGEDGHKMAKSFMSMMLPSHARRIKLYGDTTPLFHRYQVESQLDAIHSPVVQLPSGGYIVINQTEALVAIDVNSGRSTRERHIEETAYKTNLEAADEVARQLRLRDLAGLIVVDFIDMEDTRNLRTVERRIKEAMKSDRARIQLGRISHFGLLELSRQRLRPSLLEASTQVCTRCGGTGHVRSTESTALHVLRAIEDEGINKRSAEVTVYVPTAVALYVLNQKRVALSAIEKRYGFEVYLANDDTLIPPDYRLERVKGRAEADEAEAAAAPEAERAPADDTEKPGRKRRRRRAKGKDDEAEAAAEAPPAEAKAADAEAGDDESRKRRRRGKRGGRRRRRGGDGERAADADAQTPAELAEVAEQQREAESEPTPPETEKPRRRRRKKADDKAKGKAEQGEAEAEKPKRGRRGKGKGQDKGKDDKDKGEEPPLAADSAGGESAAPVAEPARPADDRERPESPAMREPPAADESGADDEDRPRRRGWWQRFME